ncbi:MAG: MOFRL family protein [Lachnospiraceae bacterium]
MALAAAEKISGLKKVAVFSVGSDGTDGPTDGAGGFVDSGGEKTGRCRIPD